jgi:chorismate synthase
MQRIKASHSSSQTFITTGVIMASNAFGTMFKITTWGESHGKAVGVVIDGCPAGVALSEDDINQALIKRAPGNSPYTSPRKEPDVAEIYSGLFEGKTTGAPVSIIIMNHDPDSSKYEPIKHLIRPGHANYTYLQKYGNFDYRGGGRSSARETACRVAAGAVAQKILAQHDIHVQASLHAVGPDNLPENQMHDAIERAKATGDSLGGVVEFVVPNLPVGLGDPIYEKLEAKLAHAMMSLPASKGFEVGEGFGASRMQGSEHNDAFVSIDDDKPTQTNHAGGTLGGISTGMPLIGRVAFKPTSSIKKPQDTVDLEGNKQVFKLPEGSRHDPCVAIRAVPVVQAMCALVLVDSLLMNRCARLEELA